jgi:inorganic pyrophosphatase
MQLMDIPVSAGRGLVHMIVDSPKGSRNKYKYDERLEHFRLSRVLPAGMQFPYDFGFIPGTAGEDGDALDVIAITESGSFAGCLMAVRLIGVIAAEQTDRRSSLRNDRLVAVPVTPVNKPSVRRIQDLPAAHLHELEQFFVSYNRIQGRRFEIIGRVGPRAAERALHKAAELRARKRTGKTVGPTKI